MAHRLTKPLCVKAFEEISQDPKDFFNLFKDYFDLLDVSYEQYLK